MLERKIKTRIATLSQSHTSLMLQKFYCSNLELLRKPVLVGGLKSFLVLLLKNFLLYNFLFYDHKLNIFSKL